jgi:phage-related protein
VRASSQGIGASNTITDLQYWPAYSYTVTTDISINGTTFSKAVKVMVQFFANAESAASFASGGIGADTSNPPYTNIIDGIRGATTGVEPFYKNLIWRGMRVAYAAS